MEERKDRIVPLVDYSSGERRVIGQAHVHFDEELQEFTVDAQVDEPVMRLFENVVKGPFSVAFTPDLEVGEGYRVSELVPIPPFKIKED